MPSSSAASKTSCESATAVPMAMVSREKRLSSMPARPWVTPSHIAGTPPATWAVAPSRCASARISAGKRSYGWCADSMSL